MKRKVFITESSEVAGMFLMSYIKYSICFKHKDYLQYRLVTPFRFQCFIKLIYHLFPLLVVLNLLRLNEVEVIHGHSETLSTCISGRNNRGTGTCWVFSSRKRSRDSSWERFGADTHTHTHTLRLHGSVGKVTANYLRDRDTILVFWYFLVRLPAIPAVRICILSSRLWHRVPLRHMAATKVSEPHFASMFGFGWRQFVRPKLPHYTTLRDTVDSTVHHFSLLHNFPVGCRISSVY